VGSDGGQNIVQHVHQFEYLINLGLLFVSECFGRQDVLGSEKGQRYDGETDKSGSGIRGSR